MAWKTLAVLAVGLLLAADDAKKDAKDKDETKIQGTWVAVSLEHAGKNVPEDEAKEISVIFAAEGKVTVKNKDKETKGTYKLDTGKKPKQITLKSDNEKSVYGIYKLDGDTLTICGVEGDADGRPTEFTSKEGTKNELIVLKRAKK